MKNPIFDDIRISYNEKQSDEKLHLKVDQDAAFDYDKGKTFLFTKDDYIDIII